MHKFTKITPLSIKHTLELLELFLWNLNPSQITAQLQLRFTIRPILALPTALLQSAFVFLLRTRFPLLIEANQQTFMFYHQQLKDLYQQQLQKSSLKSQSNFDYFVIVISKLCRLFIAQTYQSIVIDKEVEAELYCLLIKALIGLNLSVNSYRLLQKKFIDQQKCDPVRIEINAVQNHLLTTHQSYFDTKRIVTLNSVQSKLQKRKLKKFLRGQRISFQVADPQNELRKFKEDLNDSLKLKEESLKKIKIGYKTMETQMVENEKQKKQERKNRKMATDRQVLHTEQISSSLKMTLLLKNLEHSYSRKDISLRHSSPSPRFTYNTYEFEHLKKPQLLKSNNKQNDVQYPKRGISKAPTIFLKNQTKTYWYKVKKEIKMTTDSFVF